MVTGAETGTFIRFGLDIASIARQAHLDIIVKPSEGSLDNIRRMVSSENAALGIVQSDVLGFLKRSNNPEMRRIADQLRLVFPLHNEEIHLFANRTIRRLSDLAGKRVVIGTKGSGSWLTANNLFALAHIEPAERLELPPAQAISAVLAGEADAMIDVAGKPAPLFVQLQDLLVQPTYAPLVTKVHFVPIRDETVLAAYVPATITPQDYAWVDETTSTVAVKAVLIGFDFSSRRNPYFAKRCEELAQLGQVMRRNFDLLQKTGHPKWQEVDLNEELGIWQWDACARPNVPTALPPNKDLMQAIEDILLQKAP
jgi:TRAP transporter TAXI family solute receptor